MNYLDHIKERVKSPKETKILTEDMMWQHHGPLVWKADQFDGTPRFYPVYKYEGYYSFSLLALIILKGTLKINPAAERLANQNKFNILDQGLLIDLDIERLGGALKFSKKITNCDEYSRKLVDALKQDIKEIEEINNGFTNVIMCGGKDSLNLLLLPWKNPVIAVSAQPNYPLVCDFVRANNLNIEVRPLEDSYSEEYLHEEIVELCCRVDSVHWRWAHHLRKIAKEYSGKLVIWKGQIGDAFMGPRWKTYIHPEVQPDLFLCKIYKKISAYLPNFITIYFGRKISARVEKTLWAKAAISQGAHMGFIRAITDSLVLSAYHGKHVQKVVMDVSLEHAVQKDIRMKIGELIVGKAVRYPSENPSPPLSDIRNDAHRPDHLVELMKEYGIKVVSNTKK